MKSLLRLTASSSAFFTIIAMAQSHPACTGPQLGSWKLESFTTQYADSKQIVHPYGEHPHGYLSYGMDCRVYAIITSENRKASAGPVASDAERIDLFGSVIAYAGTYTVNGDKISHHVDVSWNENWVGTTLVRQFKIEKQFLHILSMPAPNPRDGRVSSSTLLWTKVE